ncbi:amino acid polyamine transporter I [Fusarium beomiforme]|uniref:Amino acid polyamine transporter I n=1 Tax=Fusarium beomiforme TaxID=44412 RepID=A0A9P5DZB1_9HYPO|nr:amino acid polyamine transporter I [Fusarium beomiforme]
MSDLEAPRSHGQLKGDMEKMPGNDTSSVQAAENVVVNDLHRTLTPRQIHIISLGSNVGSGLFIATGKALANGGPGTMFIAYLIVCSGVWANMQTLGEMTISFPVSGNYIDYAGRWVDPALAFGAGFAEWLGWTAVFAAEAEFFVVLVDYWAKGAVPHAALLSIFLVVCLIVFLLPNKAFGSLQAFGSLVKIALFVFIVIFSIVLFAGAGPERSEPWGSSWTNGMAFQNGFGGFASCALLAIWAVGDQVFVGVMAGEAESPRYSMGHAITLVPIRVCVMYMTCVVLIGVLISSDDPDLLGASGSAASPFVIAAKGIKGIPDLINVCVIIGLLAIALESIYLPSRILRTMAYQGLIPQIFGKVDERGRPRLALAFTSAIGTILTYLSLSAGGTEALNWFVSITSASFFSNWAIIAITSFFFHRALKAQGDEIFSERFAKKSIAWPSSPVHLILVCLLLLVSLFYSAIKPLAGGGFTAYNFFQNMIGLLLIVIFTIAYKLFMRTKLQSPKTADLQTGRNKLRPDEIEFLNSYYARPWWRRLGTYLSLC